MAGISNENIKFLNDLISENINVVINKKFEGLESKNDKMHQLLIEILASVNALKDGLTKTDGNHFSDAFIEQSTLLQEAIEKLKDLSVNTPKPVKKDVKESAPAAAPVSTSSVPAYLLDKNGDVTNNKMSIFKACFANEVHTRELFKAYFTESNTENVGNVDYWNKIASKVYTAKNKDSTFALAVENLKAAKTTAKSQNDAVVLM